MCGIFGFVFERHAAEDRRVKDLLQSLVTLSEARGKEAAGLAVRDVRGITVCKGALRGTAFMKTKQFKEVVAHPFLTCIGHTRLVTNGSMENSENNQPVVRGGIVGIHNGIIVNDKKLFADRHLKPTCDVDTEALLALVEDHCAKGDAIGAAVDRAFADIRGTASVALLFHDAPVLVLATNNGSLYVLAGQRGLAFASERHILERVQDTHGDLFGKNDARVRHLEAGSRMIIDLDTAKEVPTGTDVRRAGASVALTSLAVPHRAKKVGIANVFSRDSIGAHEKTYDANAARIARLKRCTKCILPETMPFIEFDHAGVCNFCRHYAKPVRLGEDVLRAEAATFRGDGSRPDCLFPLSGGRDSSYGLHYVKNVLKLTPIAYSYDWGMLTDLGRRNQARMCGELGVEHLLISADIEKKRGYIRQNVSAWLKRPDLGTVPLFMAGDKQYFYHLNRLKAQVQTNVTVYCENPLEQTNFKYGFCGVPPKFNNDHVYRIGLQKKLKLAFYYASHYVKNPRLLNSSLIDSAGAFASTYFLPHNYLYLFNYIPWDEHTINSTLIDTYDWELAPDTTTTWRIGDGTAAFYNYIYYTVAGFTENDTFRSNQIREGLRTREEGLALAKEENRPRFPSLEWYGDTIGIDIAKALDTIDAIPKRY